jgi:hypothetical protein
VGLFDDIVNAPQAGLFDDIVSPPAEPAAKPGVMDDVARSVDKGLAKGFAGLAGAPADIAGLVAFGADKLQSRVSGKPYDQVKAENDARAVLPTGTVASYGSEAMERRLAESTPGGREIVDYKPQTTAGRYAATAAGFVPGAVFGPGSVVRNVIGFGIAPGLASEAAGQLTEGKGAAEPITRAGAALATALAAGVAMRPSGAGQVLARATRGAYAGAIDAAEALFQEAHAAGLPITRAEALQHVTNGATRLADMQRVVEGQGGLRPFFAERPAQVETAGRQALDTVAPQNMQPSTIGPAVGRAAEGEIADTQTAINTATRPAYQAAEPVRVGPQIHAALTGDPLYERTLQEIRNNPALNATIAHLPDDAVGVMDLVQRRMGETAANARVPGQASSSNLAALNYENARTPAIAAAETATGGATGAYAVAREAQARLRERYLQPLVEGPLGKIANHPETKAAIEALFPTNPLPNSAGEVATAVSALARRNPQAARDLVRAHAESVFNETTQALQGGANEFGGAKFAAALRGNPQQAANLESAVRALPNGDATWAGFDRFLNLLEAQGTRQRIGSQTAFNTEALADLKGGKAVGDVASLAGGAGLQFPRFVRERFERWRLGSNVDELARLLTDPQAGPLFRQLATQSGGTGAVAIGTRLAAIAARGYNSRPGSKAVAPE